MVEDVIIVLISFFLVAGLCTYYYADIKFQNNPYKWVVFAIICLLVVIIEILMMIYRSTAKNILFIGNIIQILDSAALLLVNHLSKGIVYFAFAIFFLVWAATIAIYFHVHRKNLKKFEEQKQLDEEKKKEQQQAVPPSTTDEKTNEAKTSKKLEDKVSTTNDLDDNLQEPVEDIDLLGLELKDFDISNFAGLKQAFNASKQGLQLTKQGDDYIAVYCNSKGLQQIKKILSKNSIDASPLKAQAEIVTFNQAKIKVMPITDYLQRFKRRGND